MSRPIRLLHILRTLDVGGMEEVVATLCRTIDRDRFDSGVLCLRGEGPLADELRAEGIPVNSIDSDPSRPDYFAWLKVARFLRADPPDVVHTHNTTALLFGASAARLARVERVIHTDHSRVYPERLRIRVAESLVSYWVDHVVAVSEATYRDLEHHLWIPDAKLTTVLNGVDATRFEQAVDKVAKRRELGLPEDAQVIGLAARLVFQKGLANLLDAVRLLLPDHPDLHLVIMGVGELEADLRAQARAQNIGAAVHFLGLRRDVSEVLQALDIYVLPSLWEGLPMALLEAMAAGCSIVATNTGGVGTAIENGATGVLVEPGDLKSLADGIARLLNAPDLARRMGGAARKVFEERFSAAVMARHYERLYLGESKQVVV